MYLTMVSNRKKKMAHLFHSIRVNPLYICRICCRPQHSFSSFSSHVHRHSAVSPQCIYKKSISYIIVTIFLFFFKFVYRCFGLT